MSTPSRFAALLATSSKNPFEIAEVQQRASDQFPALVRRSKLQLWELGQKVVEIGTRVLIGVAAGYNQPDLTLLDEIDAELRRERISRVHVDVFDLGACKSFSEVESFIPGIGKAYSSPVVGIWENGILIERGIGGDAVAIIRRILFPRTSTK